jgi:hypothetical protein
METILCRIRRQLIYHPSYSSYRGDLTPSNRFLVYESSSEVVTIYDAADDGELAIPVVLLESLSFDVAAEVDDSFAQREARRAALVDIAPVVVSS